MCSLNRCILRASTMKLLMHFFKTALSTEMSTLKSKIKTLEEQNRALTSQLKTEKGKLVLLQTQFESARKHEREIP